MCVGVRMPGPTWESLGKGPGPPAFVARGRPVAGPSGRIAWWGASRSQGCSTAPRSWAAR